MELLDIGGAHWIVNLAEMTVDLFDFNCEVPWSFLSDILDVTL